MKTSVRSPTRWRSSRRRSSEKSARQMRREAQSYSPDRTDIAQLMRPGNIVQPATWLQEGALVRFAPSSHVAANVHTVLATPFRITPSGAWVTLITGVRGWVPCDALTLAPSQPSKTSPQATGGTP